MTLPIPVRERREILPPEGEEWLRGGNGGAWKYFNPLAEVWAAHRDRIVIEHVRDYPGSRPRHWWTYDSPEPGRKRLGGVGDRLCLCSAYAENYEFGLPSEGWRRVGDGFSRGVPIDFNNLPKFESQAAYLRRLGLFLPGERERLKPAHFRSVRIR